MIIGRGGHGEVSLGCFNKACVYKYAAKRSLVENLSLEYRINTLAYSIVPKHVVRPIAFVNGVILSDYVPLSKITPANFKKVLKQVLIALMKLQKAYPSFRHNDLSWKNVFVTEDGRAYLGDFGLANIEKDGYRNPIIQSNKFKYTHGTYPNNDPKFDIHFFLNSLILDNVSGLSEMAAQYLPPEYRGVETSKIKMGRLREGVSHTSMPTMKQLFSKLKVKNEQTSGSRMRKSSGQRKGRS
jgi:hypothetical protein